MNSFVAVAESSKPRCSATKPWLRRLSHGHEVQATRCTSMKRALVRQLRFNFDRNHVLARWCAEHSSVLAAELGRAFIADAVCGLGGVKTVPKHEPACFLKAQPLLVLKRTQSCYALEMKMK